MGRSHRLERHQFLPHSPERVFPFFADASNLERLTPEFLNFKILTPHPVAMFRGARIEYELKLFGLPFAWLTEITTWEPNVRFVDQQLKGPYKRWHHLHEFRVAAGGTEMVDEVDYELPFGVFGELAHALRVESTLNRIFDYRQTAIAEALGALAPS